MAYDFYDFKTNRPGKWQETGETIGDILFNGVLGLADWIGLGTKIRGMIDDKTDIDQIKTALTSRINSLIQKGQIEENKLLDKLNNLAQMGFSLTGVARNRYSDEVAKASKAYKNKVTENAKRNQDLTLIQSDVDRIKNLQDSNSVFSYLRDNKGIQQHVENELNQMGG